MSSNDITNSESTLISIAKWGLLTVKIPGYFPISVSTSSMKILTYSKLEKRQYLSFSYCSGAALYVIILSTLLSCWDLIFFARQSSFHKYLKARGPTEIYAYTLMLATSSMLGVYVQIFGLRKASKFLKYWEDTCTIFDQLQTKLGLNLGTLERFNSIENSIRNSFAALIIPILIHVLIDYGYRITDSILHEDGTNEDTQLAIGLGVWTFFSLSGSGISVWMTFFIQFYTACLYTVGNSLREISVDRFSTPGEALSRKSSNFSGEDELFTRMILQQRHPVPKSNNQGEKRVAKVDIETTLETCLSLFQSILGGISNFNSFFGVILIFEISACVLNLLVYLFFALVWLGRGEIGLLMETVVPIYIYGKELYDVGSFSEELTSAAESVVKSLGQNLPLDTLSPHMHLKV